jgi:outer membrane protein OmpA-like peptidoglycan-associated protein
MATSEPSQDYSAHSNFDPINETIQLHGIADLLAELANEDQPFAESVAKSLETENKQHLPPIPDLVRQVQPGDRPNANQIPATVAPEPTLPAAPSTEISAGVVPQVPPVSSKATKTGKGATSNDRLIAKSSQPLDPTVPKLPESASVVVATNKLNALLNEVSQLRDAQASLTTHISDLELQLKEAEPQPLNILSESIDDPDSSLSGDVDRLKSSQAPPRSPLARFGLIIFLLLLGLIPAGIYQYFKLVERGREKAVELKLGSVPQLSVYRIEVDARGNNLHLRGKLPHRHLRDLAEEVAVSALPGFKVNNEIITIAIPTDPVLVNTAALRLANAFTQIDGMNINAQLQDRKLILSGTAIRQQNIDALVPAFSQIPGVAAVENQVKFTPPAIATRVYFAFESATVEPRDLDGKLPIVKQFLRQNPGFRLRIIGYANANEYLAAQLAQERAQAVKNILEDQGIDRRRMEAIAGDGAPPGVTQDQEDWLNQSVLFELIDPEPKSN